MFIHRFEVNHQESQRKLICFIVMKVCVVPNFCDGLIRDSEKYVHSGFKCRILLSLKKEMDSCLF